MYIKKYKLGNTIFCFKGEMPLFDGGNLALFLTDEDHCDYDISLRFASENEETPHGFGYAYIEREQNKFFVALNEEKIPTPSCWQLFLILPFASLMLERLTVSLHSAFIIKNNEAILFSGESGAGKSTQASLWETYADAEIINGDRVFLYMKDNEVYAASHFYNGTSGICIDKTAKVKAIVFLQKGEENCLLDTPAIALFQKFISQSAYDTNSGEQIENLTKAVSDIMNSTRVLYYSCKKDESAVLDLERFLYGK